MDSQKLDDLQRTTSQQRLQPFTNAVKRSPQPVNFNFSGDHGVWSTGNNKGDYLQLYGLQLRDGWELSITWHEQKTWCLVIQNRQQRIIYYRSLLGKKSEPGTDIETAFPPGPIPAKVFDSAMPHLLRALKAYASMAGLEIT